MFTRLRAFLRMEDGSIGEYVVMAAGTAAVAMAVSGAIRDGGQATADNTDAEMQHLGRQVDGWVAAGVDG